MIKFVLTFSLFIVATTASSEFSILSNPKSIEFRGNEVLGSQYIGDVLSAAVGHTITTDANWDGLYIKDPFDLSRGIVAILVEGIDHVSFGAAAKTYELEGNRGAESINSLAVELQAENLNVCNVNFNDFDNGISSYHKCFADIGEPQMDQSVYLKPDEYVGDRHFLQAIAYMKAAAKNYSNMRKTTHFLAMHIPLKKIVSVHGKSSDAMSEALNILVAAADNLNSAAQRAHNNNAIVVAIVSEHSMIQRAKREALPATKDSNPLNLAEFYTQDYPVIFNIILWFMVVFGLALLAICYAIASMDPGRDSIIYRMTSTRMKKDN